MELFDYVRSSSAYRVRICLNLKGIEYDSKAINLLEKQQSSESYKALNPQGLVPALNDDGQLVTQSIAICEYLEEKYSNTPAILPTNLEHKAHVKALALSIACDIQPLNNLRILNYLVQDMGLSDEQKMTWYHHWIQEGFTALEAQLAKSELTGDFCFGNSPTLADICLVPQVFNAKRFKASMDNYPNINRIVENCEKLEAFAKAHPDNQ
jgi:maleylacetoacetate isomerase